jgi:hypothetical protein
MTEYAFKNGITIHIPDDMQNQLEQWTAVKVAMSLMLTPNPPEVELREKKPYSMKHRNAQIKRRTKNWRSPKKLK